MRRADLPIAYSEGFSPHPKVSFPDALPLGYASYGEYAELQFAGDIALPRAMEGLTAAFPEGLAILDAVEVVEGAPRLAKWLRASLWALEYPSEFAPALDAAVAALLAADAVPVDRDRKGEITETDLRPAIHQLSHQGAVPQGGSSVPPRSRTTIGVVLHHTEPPMRPSEVHQALSRATEAHAGAPLPDLAHATRLAQGEPTSGGLTEALSGEELSPHEPHDIKEGDHDRPEHT